MCLRVPGCLTHCPRYMSAGERAVQREERWGVNGDGFGRGGRIKSIL